MTRRGDTLLEVALAFVILSIVTTIAIVAMNAGILRLEGALELSLARTEIDAQAEALRFVHNAYVRNPNDEEGTYYRLWSAITKQANEDMSKLPQFQPSSCSSLYDDQSDNIYNAHAFILNTRDIRPREGTNESAWTKSLIVARPEESIFSASDLYPRLVYTVPATDTGEEKTTDDVLQEVGEYKKLAKVEGIYITEVQGDDKTFYDFYIYTCFMEPGEQRPTTIGTTVRLYDPDF